MLDKADSEVSSAACHRECSSLRLSNSVSS